MNQFDVLRESPNHKALKTLELVDWGLDMWRDEETHKKLEEIIRNNRKGGGVFWDGYRDELRYSRDDIFWMMDGDLYNMLKPFIIATDRDDEVRIARQIRKDDREAIAAGKTLLDLRMAL